MYLIDANIFITAYKTYYAFDIAPSFWNAVVKMADENKLCSIDKVKGEILPKELENYDELATWTSEKFLNNFESTKASDVQDCYRKLMNWAMKNDVFTNAAKADFASNADGWLVAYAMAKGYTVVTHEKYNPQSKKRVMIPNVCEVFGVKYVDTFTMLRELELQF